MYVQRVGFFRGSAVGKVRVPIADELFYGFGSSGFMGVLTNSDLALVRLRIADVYFLLINLFLGAVVGPSDQSHTPCG